MTTTAQDKTLRLVLLSLLAALIVIMTVVPFLGYIPLGVMNATTIHIPVIIGAILLGPKEGGILGGIFGLTSLLKNTFQPNLTSFVFTPFYSVGEMSGNFCSLLVCFVPRILIGVVAGYLFRLIATKENRKLVACVVSGFVGSLTNTVLVMGGIYLFFGSAYAAAKEMAFESLFNFIAVIVGTQGVPEAIVAAVLAALVGRPLLKLMPGLSKKTAPARPKQD